MTHTQQCIGSDSHSKDRVHNAQNGEEASHAHGRSRSSAQHAAHLGAFVHVRPRNRHQRHHLSVPPEELMQKMPWRGHSGQVFVRSLTMAPGSCVFVPASSVAVRHLALRALKLAM